MKFLPEWLPTVFHILATWSSCQFSRGAGSDSLTMVLLEFYIFNLLFHTLYTFL